LPGPSVSGRYRPLLAAYLSRSGKVRARTSARARPRAGRIRPIGVGSVAPFETEPTTPAAHTEPDAPARATGRPVLRIARVIFQGMPNRSFDTLIGDLPPKKIACCLVPSILEQTGFVLPSAPAWNTTARITRTCHLGRVAPNAQPPNWPHRRFTERSCPGPSRLTVALHSGAKGDAEGSRTGRLSAAQANPTHLLDKTTKYQQTQRRLAACLCSKHAFSPPTPFTQAEGVGGEKA